MEIFKKVCSVIILSLGTLMVMGLLLTFSVQSPASDVQVAAPIMGIIGVLLILLGIKLWDWNYIKVLLGIVFSILGIIFLILSVPQYLISVYSATIQIVYGAVLLPIGVLLIIIQYKSDKKQRNKILKEQNNNNARTHNIG